MLAWILVLVVQRGWESSTSSLALGTTRYRRVLILVHNLHQIVLVVLVEFGRDVVDGRDGRLDRQPGERFGVLELLAEEREGGQLSGLGGTISSKGQDAR